MTLDAAAIVTPEDGQQLAAALQAAARDDKVTVISGGGTKLEWGRPPVPIDLLLRTSRLTQVTHRHADLTATVGAGAALVAVNRELARHGQWLPIDSAFEGATIGGIVASNDAGPLRHRYGTPRDRVLGATLAMTDGRLVKAGGTVVKNVAGYDLARLVSGSFGTLAAIDTVTFKTEPLPAASATLRVRAESRVALSEAAQALRDSALELTALDVRASWSAEPAFELLLRVASSPVSTRTQLARARALIGADAAVAHDAEETDLWRQWVGAPWTGTAAVIRVSWRPADMSGVLALVDDLHRLVGMPVMLIGRVGVGAGTVRIEGPAHAQATAVSYLRASSLVGHVVVLRSDSSVKTAVDVWGPIGESERVMLAIKQKLDPRGILNAGRGPI